MEAPLPQRFARTDNRLFRLLRSERGIAVPITLWVMVITTGLAVAASTASLVAQTGATRDSGTKRALQIADAGAIQALYNYNKIATTVPTSPCLVNGSGGALVAGAAQADGWCPAQSGAVNGGTFTYQVKAPAYTDGTQSKVTMTVASTGTYQSQTRRVAVTASSATSTSTALFGGHSVQSLNDLTLNGNARIDGSGASNQSIRLNGNATLCGDAQHGLSGDLIFTGNANQCNGYTNSSGTLTLPPVDPGNSWTVNDDGRFFGLDTKTGNVSWDSTTRSLSMSGNSSLTLGGSVYSFCSFSMAGNSTLFIAASAQVKIYLDSPEQCGTNGGSQLSMSGNARVSNTSGNPVAAQVYMVGSSSKSTSASLSGNGAVRNDMLLYAPKTDVSISGNGTYNGAVAGKSVTISGNGHVTYDSRVDGVSTLTNVIPLYTRDRYVECSGIAGSGQAANFNC